MGRGVPNACLFSKRPSLDKPKLSVCIPAFNGAAYIQQAVQSVLAQTWGEYELVVCDDASSDDTRERVAAFSDPRIRLERNPARLGLVGNWNRCLALAHGEYICIFHQDDVMLPGFAHSSCQALDCHKTASFTFANIQTINETGHVLGGHWSPHVLPMRDSFFSGNDFLKILCANGNIVPCSTVVMRAPAARAARGFDDRLAFTPDFEKWLRICLEGDVVYLSRQLVQIRTHRGQTTNQFIEIEKVKEVRKAFQIFFTRHDDDASFPSHLKPVAQQHFQKWSRWMGRLSIRQGHPVEAARFLRESRKLI